jgi:hypothetical protein
VSRLAILDIEYVNGLVSPALRPRERRALLYFLALYDLEPEAQRTAVETAAEMGEIYSFGHSNPLDSALACLVSLKLVECEMVPTGGGNHSALYRLGPAAIDELNAGELSAFASVGAGPRSRLSELAGRLEVAT